MIDRIRAWAMALPEVTEKEHVRFKVPLWQVRKKTVLGMGRDGSTAVFCITEESAEAKAAADPGSAEAVHRRDARRSFLGLEVKLGVVSPQTIEALVHEAWVAQAPRALHDQLLRGPGDRGPSTHDRTGRGAGGRSGEREPGHG